MSLFTKEADLCQAFLETVPADWTAYPETGGFDILLVHTSGAQIGIEAKLRLNAKVILQAVESDFRWSRGDGPDFRAVLVPSANEMAGVCRLLGLTVITVHRRIKGSWSGNEQRSKDWCSSPKLPDVERVDDWYPSVHWYDQAPLDRVRLPDYVPEVAAGVPSPMVLSNWKIQAMRVCVWVERHGAITREHFKALKIDPSRWMTGHWLRKGPVRGQWVAGPQFPADSYRKNHGTVYAQVEADFEAWATAAKLVPCQVQGALL